MISKQAQELKDFFRGIFVPELDWRSMDWTQVRKEVNALDVFEPLPEGITVTQDRLNGISVERIQVPGNIGKVIMHMHGGGMTMRNCSSSRFMLSHIGVLSGRNTVSVEYRLCPEYSQPAAVEDCVVVYRELLKEYAPQDIALLGESAGGMLVLSLLAYLKKHVLPMPGCACAISSSADPRYNSPSMEANRDTEVVVCLNLKQVMNEYYFCGGDLSDPVLNPMDSDVSGWPPVYFYACDDEILRDESVRFHEKLEAAGIRTKITIKEGLFHCYMLYDLPESYETYQEIADFFTTFD